MLCTRYYFNLHSCKYIRYLFQQCLIPLRNKNLYCSECLREEFHCIQFVSFHLLFCFVLGLRIRIANLLFKLLTCVLYIFRVITDLDPTYAAWLVHIILFNQSSNLLLLLLKFITTFNIHTSSLEFIHQWMMQYKYNFL